MTKNTLENFIILRHKEQELNEQEQDEGLNCIDRGVPHETILCNLSYLIQGQMKKGRESSNGRGHLLHLSLTSPHSRLFGYADFVL